VNINVLDTRDYGFDADRVAPAETILRALRRRFDGRYPVDPFGLDPQLCDLTAPAWSAALRVDIAGGEHVPARGPAVLVANRGFGVFEPAAVALAVQRTVGRRLRVVGAPSLPVLGRLTRRFGAIHSSEEDVSACLRSGHLVGVPLAPTWLRTGAGTPPLALMQATTHSPIVPVAVAPGGPFGTMLRPWRVAFGPLVTLPDPYDPGDPLTAARFAEAVRDSVRGLLDVV
jgi:1-acyl-sn-glycerol-3-phosphate acyltransferase